MPDNLPTPTLTTKRLRLRAWRDQDLEAFAQMNADPRVMEFMPKRLSRAESDELAARIGRHFATHGFGLWAVEIVDVAPFAGFVGLAVPTFEAHFTPCVEIGWRMASGYWGQGYATEGAAAAMDFGLAQREEIVAMTVPHNRASRRVMEKLGMHHNPADDFDHPLLPTDHPLRPHVLYRMKRADWTRPVAG